MYILVVESVNEHQKVKISDILTAPRIDHLANINIV